MYYPEPKKKLAISEILDIFIRLVTIAAVIAPVIGYFIIFDYLLGIDQLSFFYGNTILPNKFFSNWISFCMDVFNHFFTITVTYNFI